MGEGKGRSRQPGELAALGEILPLVAGSADAAVVFEAIARHAVRLCAATDAHVYVTENEAIHHAAGFPPTPSELKLGAVVPFNRGSVIARAVIDRTLVHVADFDALAPEEFSFTRLIVERSPRRWRTQLAVPLLRDGRAVGVLSLRRVDARPFSQQHLRLVQMLASQAVIALEKRAHRLETKALLEQQTAVSEILRTISGSPTDVRPILYAVAESAMRTTHGAWAAIVLVHGERIDLAALTRSRSGERERDIRALFPMPAAEKVALWSVMDAIRAAAFPQFVEPSSDLRDAFAARYEAAARAGAGADELQALVDEYSVNNAALWSDIKPPAMRAMHRHGRAVGALMVLYDQPGEFTAKEKSLLTTFAYQAEIAMDNVRLLHETAESLKNQTATAAILRTIAGSHSDVHPVFDAIAAKAMRLTDFQAVTVAITLLQEGRVELASFASNWSRGVGSPWGRLYPQALDGDSLTARAVREKKALNAPEAELAGAPELVKGPDGKPLARSVVAVPLMRQGEAIGALVAFRRTPAAAGSEKLAVLETFAAQAVIAIDNVRLFKELEARNRELREALDQQTALSDVLKVVSRTTSDAAPVFRALLDRASRLCEAEGARVYGQGVASLSYESAPGAPVPPLADEAERAAARDGLVAQLTDVVDAQAFRIISLPLMRERSLIGVLTLWRSGVAPFGESQVALLQSFAHQAVIAVENARLCTELQSRNKQLADALDQQTATSDILKVISRTIFDLQPVLEIVLESACRLCEADRGIVFRPDPHGVYHPEVFTGRPQGSPRPQLEARPITVDRASATGRAIADGRTVHIADVLADPAYQRLDLVRASDYRTILAVPLLRAGVPIGVLTLTRNGVPRPFTQKQIELVTMFADQAVIAIENVRLFHEIQDKSRELEAANQHKSDFLAHMSHELRTPLNAIIGFSEALGEKMFGELNEKQADYVKDIHESGKHLLSLINDILDLSKIEAGKMELELSTFHLPTAISNALVLVRERALRHGIELASQIDPRLAEFQADERKLKQVLLNLLSNAVKFTPEGGRVDVTAALDTDHVEIAVRDTGAGIAPEDQGSLFEEFRQVGRDRLKKAEGTGLGLALSKRFVELHGGRIRVDSAPGRGSTFAFTLPMRQ